MNNIERESEYRRLRLYGSDFDSIAKKRRLEQEDLQKQKKLQNNENSSCVLLLIAFVSFFSGICCIISYLTF